MYKKITGVSEDLCRDNIVHQKQ